jgi:hypothetical protein
MEEVPPGPIASRMLGPAKAVVSDSRNPELT